MSIKPYFRSKNTYAAKLDKLEAPAEPDKLEVPIKLNELEVPPPTLEVP